MWPILLLASVKLTSLMSDLDLFYVWPWLISCLTLAYFMSNLDPLAFTSWMNFSYRPWPISLHLDDLFEMIPQRWPWGWPALSAWPLWFLGGSLSGLMLLRLLHLFYGDAADDAPFCLQCFFFLLMFSCISCCQCCFQNRLGSLVGCGKELSVSIHLQ